jgi:hypothetical protein
MVLPLMKSGVFSQLTCSACIEMETVTKLPAVAEDMELGSSVTVAPVMFEPASSC